jgi:hypothetical protein
LDVLAHVMRNQPAAAGVTTGSAGSVTPATRYPFMGTMLERGLIGEKAGQGFYKKVKKPDGSSEILVLDLQTLEYRPQQKPRFPSIETAKAIEDTGARLKTLFLGKDRVGEFLRATSASHRYRRSPWIAHDPADIDRAMRWAGWELHRLMLHHRAGECGLNCDDNVTVPCGNPGNEVPILSSAAHRRRVTPAHRWSISVTTLGIEFHSNERDRRRTVAPMPA